MRDSFGMTLHALKRHAPDNAVFALSSLGRPAAPLAPGGRGARSEGAATLHPQNLERPLLWLVEALRAQDEARLDKLFQLTPLKIGLLEPCVRGIDLLCQLNDALLDRPFTRTRSLD